MSQERSPWESLPLELKIEVAKFLDINTARRLAATKVEYNKNRNAFICASASAQPEQITCTNDLTRLIAQLMKVKPDDISKSERFENKMIQVIRALNPEELSFLTKNTDVSNNAQYKVETTLIGFLFKQYDKKQLFQMASILEQHLNIKCHLIQIEENGSYWIAMDKNLFLQKILPVMFEVKPIPPVQNSVAQPVVKDFERKRQYYITRRDGNPLTKEDIASISAILEGNSVKTNNLNFG